MPTPVVTQRHMTECLSSYVARRVGTSDVVCVVVCVAIVVAREDGDVKREYFQKLWLRIRMANASVDVAAYQSLFASVTPLDIRTHLAQDLVRKKQLWPAANNTQCALQSQQPATELLAPRLRVLGHMSTASDFDAWLCACTRGPATRAEQLLRIRVWCGLCDNNGAPLHGGFAPFIAGVCNRSATESESQQLLRALLSVPPTVSLAALRFLVEATRTARSVCTRLPRLV